MRLSEYIEKHHEVIVEEWVAFAKSLLPWAKGMDDKALRDHAEELLDAVVVDMETPQSKGQQASKSQGQAAPGALAKVGQKHAAQRMDTGFNLDQLVSEYRALRASILRLWSESQGDKKSEITRFNEAIDESLGEAAIRYSKDLETTRDQFLGILGHDLRNPLGAIIMGATLLTSSESIDDKQARVAARISNSARRMDRMVTDLLDLTRTRLGKGLPITPKPMDLTPVCEQLIAELEAIHPDQHVRFEGSGDLLGEWDSDRLTQMISNLVANALQYGSDDTPVTLLAEDHGKEVSLQVHNRGAIIAEKTLKHLFEPMVREPAQVDKNVTGLGLGLYIAREVATAHGGTITASSTAKKGTTFTVKLPRFPAAPETGEDRASVEEASALRHP